MRALGHGPARKHSRTRALRLWAGRLIAVSLVLTASTAIAAAAATATNGASSGASEAMFIAELGLLLLVGRLMGEAAQRLGQPAVMGQLIGGLLLGPSVFGLIWPSAQHALFPGRRRAEEHDRRRLAARHPDAAAADRHGNRPAAGADASAAPP